jgi:hypothetical protein
MRESHVTTGERKARNAKRSGTHEQVFLFIPLLLAARWHKLALSMPAMNYLPHQASQCHHLS